MVGVLSNRVRHTAGRIGLAALSQPALGPQKAFHRMMLSRIVSGLCRICDTGLQTVLVAIPTIPHSRGKINQEKIKMQRLLYRCIVLVSGLVRHDRTRRAASYWES